VAQLAVPNNEPVASPFKKLAVYARLEVSAKDAVTAYEAVALGLKFNANDEVTAKSEYDDDIVLLAQLEVPKNPTVPFDTDAVNPLATACPSTIRPFFTLNSFIIHFFLFI